ncbi:hypothetical protein HETIRDRAFT_147333 [Heterobasidion irregulare TC 32-1]|uniref:Uncharacterized protein n=1 Tax=Heterobasidion irregulare (strain TC 32-1) TaxID=747525 RepID=W4K0J5_HETIT|nr:uncharacterized protein HETIRDRAFT_147333 [Heterobasidion irregulare TC 32-1]ETW78840.1 hypothetical protein HETIRDRAFT_147333 [Heterobasidion irregulare TC 32-1]
MNFAFEARSCICALSCPPLNGWIALGSGFLHKHRVSHGSRTQELRSIENCTTKLAMHHGSNSDD